MLSEQSNQRMEAGGLNPNRPSPLARYGVAALVSALALTVNLIKQPLIPAPIFALFFAAVLVSAWYGGLGPALLSTLVASIAAWHLTVDAPLVIIIRISVLLVEAFVISWLALRSRQAEAALRKMNLELEERVQSRTVDLRASNQQLQDFSYTIAHDLRAPLRAMKGYSEMLIEENCAQLNESGRNYAQRISEAAKRMDDLICDLLEYRQISQRELNLQPHDLNELVEGVLKKLAHAIQDRGAAVEVQSPLPRVICDREVMMRALLELLSNALKFVPKERPAKVRVWADEYDRVARLWIEDNGIGIEPRFYDRIFGVFERLRSEQPGTGIGLATVKKGVERMRGHVGVESEPERASRFWIELPRA